MKNFLITAAALTLINFTPLDKVEAANADDELSIMAAEQRKTNDADVTVKEDIETFENKPPVEENPKIDEQPVENNQQDQPPETPESVPKVENNNPSTENLQIEPPTNSDRKNLPADEESQIISDPNTVENLQDSVGMPSPIVTYSNFGDAAKKVGFIPLYIPKKSGYSMNYIAVISGNIVEIRYGRRWEPNVTLSVRTYKRAPGEELKDISGVYGVKWKIDLSSGTTIYIARISDKSNVAAWAAGQYTFAAMTENLSFAAFHSLIVEELVDLCTHYFIET